MKRLVVLVLMNLLGYKRKAVGGKEYEAKSNLILLPSDLGGGKTHSLILLYHVFELISNSNDKEEAASKLRMLDNDIAEFVRNEWDSIKGISPKVVTIDCKYSDLAPSSVKPINVGGRKIKTLWGYLGYELKGYDGYEHMKAADEAGTAPYVDDLFKVLDGSRAVVLIDEIGRYYVESGLDPTTISTFLMNLAEALNKHTVREVAVVISVPYEKGRGSNERDEYVHPRGLIEAIDAVLSRQTVEVIKPVVGSEDLAEILKRRIFDYRQDELERLADEFIDNESRREYPDQVKSALRRRGFWKEVKKTYPFHPMFLAVLEKLAYNLPHLQRTRDAIKIAVQAVLALREGLFDAVEDNVNLIMPYHIPLFVDEAIEETVLRNASTEYRQFKVILKSNVVEPKNLDYLIKLKNKLARDEFKKRFYEEIVARELGGLKEDEVRMGFKLASIIWLHSLVGLGIPTNMGSFASTEDLIYSVSPTEQDVKGILGILRSVLPQLIVIGDPESDGARWFFGVVPSIDDFIAELKRNITDEDAKKELAKLLEDGLLGGKGRRRAAKGNETITKFFKLSSVVPNVTAIPREAIELNDPVLIVLADTASEGDLLNLLKGRNNIVVLAPHIKGIDEEEKLKDEDIEGVRELAGFRGRTAWHGLLEILKYYRAAESITEDQLKILVGQEIGESQEEYLNDLLKLLKEKVESKLDYYYRHSWNMINRCYNKVYYHRQGRILSKSGLSLESDKPIPLLVEEFLREKEQLIPEEFQGEDLEHIIKEHLGKDPREEPISIDNLWKFILTTEKADVPLISHEDFIKAVEDLVKRLDYVVEVKAENYAQNVLWKPIFNDLQEAQSSDEGEKLLDEINERLKEANATWDDVELVYWEKAFTRWLDYVAKSVPSDAIIKVLDRSGKEYDLDYLKGLITSGEAFTAKNIIKSGKLFYEKKKYPVELKYSTPNEMQEGTEYEMELTITVKNLDKDFVVTLQPDAGLSVVPREFRGRSPLPIKFKIKAEKAGSYNIKLIISSSDGYSLDFRSIPILVKGTWLEREIELGSEEVTAQVREEVKLERIWGNDLAHLPEIANVMRKFGGSANGSITISDKSGATIIKVDIGNAKNALVLELIGNYINSLLRAMKEEELKVVTELQYTPEEEPNLQDVLKLLRVSRGLKVRVKEKSSMR